MIVIDWPEDWENRMAVVALDATTPVELPASDGHGPGVPRDVGRALRGQWEAWRTDSDPGAAFVYRPPHVHERDSNLVVFPLRGELGTPAARRDARITLDRFAEGASRLDDLPPPDDPGRAPGFLAVGRRRPTEDRSHRGGGTSGPLRRHEEGPPA